MDEQQREHDIQAALKDYTTDELLDELGRRSLHYGDPWRQEMLAMRLERDSITAALSEARERETMLREALLSTREMAYDALNQFDAEDDTLPDSRAMYVQMKLCHITDTVLATLTTPPPTDPPRHPHGSMTAAEGEALAAAVPGEREQATIYDDLMAGRVVLVRSADDLPLEAYLRHVPWGNQRFVRTVDADGKYRGIPLWGDAALHEWCRQQQRMDALPTAPPTGSGEMEETKQ